MRQFDLLSADIESAETLKVNHIIRGYDLGYSWSKQAYIQGFHCESVTLKKAVNMFDRMEIDESIYKVVVEPSYKNLHGHTPTVLITAVKIEEKPPRYGLALRRVRAL